MTTLLLCLLLPLAFLTQGWVGHDSGPVEDGKFSRLRGWLVDWPSRTTVSRILVLALAAMVAATTIATLIHERSLLFDDSFISYRYSKNLALGNGLRWNQGETPSEGYTNFLLVILLAPVIRLGGDPLLATRVLSVVAALGMVMVAFRMVRRDLNASWPVAAILALGILTCSYTAELSMVGLETVLFAASLFFSYDLSQRFFETDRRGFMLASGVVAFVAFLLRPDAIFLPIAIIVVSVLLNLHVRQVWLRVLVLLALGFGLPLALYLAWKLYYFGSIWPNPAFVKIPGQGLVRARGIASVNAFLNAHWKLFLVAALGLPFAKGQTRGLLTCSIVVVAYLLFYVRVDTLMDVDGRFLYPAFPFLLVMAFPPLARFTTRLLDWNQVSSLRVALGLPLFLAVLYRNSGDALHRVASRGRLEPTDDTEVHQASTVLKRTGTALAGYAKVNEVIIGSTDAGLLPYVSGARHVDMAGLVTRFIAVHKDAQIDANYFFAQHPDMIIVRTTNDGKLITFEHGVLGNYTLWAHNRGWDEYREGAAVHAGPRFDLHFFLRRGASHEQALERITDSLQDPDALRVATVMGSEVSH